MLDFNDLIALALKNGAYKATVIGCDSIVTSKEFRKICETNQCGVYNKCLMCPPYIGDIDCLIEKVYSYKNALLYQTVSEIEDSFDIEGMIKSGKNHCDISRKIGEDFQKQCEERFLHLTCGGCRYCERCAALDNKECYFPSQALSSMEGYGIDVYKTTKQTDLKYINGKNTVTFFGAILFGGM